MEKILLILKEAKKQIQSANHFFSVTYPFLREWKILVRVVLCLKEGIVHTMNAMLFHEYLYKRVTLYKEPRENLRIFRQKCFKVLDFLDDEVDKIFDLLSLAERCSRSQVHFSRNEEVVLLNEIMEKSIFNEKIVKEYVALSRRFFLNTKSIILRNF